MHVWSSFHHRKVALRHLRQAMSGIDYSKWDNIPDESSDSELSIDEPHLATATRRGGGENISSAAGPSAPAPAGGAMKGSIRVKRSPSGEKQEEGAVIFLHGSGDTGPNILMHLRATGFEQVRPAKRLPESTCEGRQANGVVICIMFAHRHCGIQATD